MRSRRRISDLILAFTLSYLFTIILLYAVLDILLYAPPPLEILRYFRVPTDVFLDFFWDFYFRLCRGLAGFIIFATVSILTVMGFLSGKARIPSLGSIGLYLQVLGRFTFSMLFYWICWGGIGYFLRALLLPIRALGMGNVVYVPYKILILLLEHTFPLMGVNLPPTMLKRGLSYTIMLLGFLIFFFGAATWLYGKFREYGIIDFWIYRFSRHPQYLGFIVWSYGLLACPPSHYFSPYYLIPPPSLLWLILTLIVIGSALNEESSLIKKYGEEYARYRAETPFMIPLPKSFVNFLTMPVKALFGKNIPERMREIVGTLLIYGLILALLPTPTALKP